MHAACPQAQHGVPLQPPLPAVGASDAYAHAHRNPAGAGDASGQRPAGDASAMRSVGREWFLQQVGVVEASWTTPGMLRAKTRNAIQMGDPLASPHNQFQ